MWQVQVVFFEEPLPIHLNSKRGIHSMVPTSASGCASIVSSRTNDPAQLSSRLPSNTTPERYTTQLHDRKAHATTMC